MDDAHGVNAGKCGVVQILIQHEAGIVAVHAADVQLRAEGLDNRIFICALVLVLLHGTALLFDQFEVLFFGAGHDSACLHAHHAVFIGGAEHRTGLPDAHDEYRVALDKRARQHIVGVGQILDRVIFAAFCAQLGADRLPCLFKFLFFDLLGTLFLFCYNLPL